MLAINITSLDVQSVSSRATLEKHNPLQKEHMASFFPDAGLFFFIPLKPTHDQLIHETNLSDNEDDSDAGPPPTLSCHTTVVYTTLFRCTFHIYNNTYLSLSCGGVRFDYFFFKLNSTYVACHLSPVEI